MKLGLLILPLLLGMSIGVSPESIAFDYIGQVKQIKVYHSNPIEVLSPDYFKIEQVAGIDSSVIFITLLETPWKKESKIHILQDSKLKSEIIITAKHPSKKIKYIFPIPLLLLFFIKKKKKDLIV